MRLLGEPREPVARVSTSPRIGGRAGVAAKLSEFTIGAVTEGQDALGEVSVVLEIEGFTGAGQGVRASTMGGHDR